MRIIHFENIKKNYNDLVNETNKKIYTVLKSNAYNHGIKKVCKTLYDEGCNNFCVINALDIKEIRKVAKKANILLLNRFDYDINQLHFLIRNQVTLTIGTLEDLQVLSKLNFSKIKVQIEVKSFMNRFGFNKEELETIIELINSSQNIILTGIYSHFSNAFSDVKRYLAEYNNFKQVSSIFPKNIDIHFSSSEGNKHEIEISNAIRVGVDLYDKYSTMFVYGKIVKINKVSKGESLSYYNDYIFEKDSLVGIVDLGYYDGIIKKYKNNEVCINHKMYKVVGNVCMNVCFILIDDSIKMNDKVEFLGSNIHLKDLSKKFEMSKHEVLLMFK